MQLSAVTSTYLQHFDISLLFDSLWFLPGDCLAVSVSCWGWWGWGEGCFRGRRCLILLRCPCWQKTTDYNHLQRQRKAWVGGEPRASLDGLLGDTLKENAPCWKARPSAHRWHVRFPLRLLLWYSVVTRRRAPSVYQPLQMKWLQRNYSCYFPAFDQILLFFMSDILRTCVKRETLLSVYL